MIRSLRITAVASLWLLFSQPAPAAENMYFFLNHGSSYFFGVSGVFMSESLIPKDDTFWALEYALTEEGVDYYRLRPKNYTFPEINDSLHVENGPLQVGTEQPGWWSAMWAFESTGGEEGLYRIRNRWTGKYIHTEGGKGPVIGDIEPGWEGAQWSLIAVETPTGVDQKSTHESAKQIAANYLLESGKVQPQLAETPDGGTTVSFRVQNYSEQVLDIHIDVDDVPYLVQSIGGNQQVILSSPKDAVWRLSQGDEWVESFFVDGEGGEQVVQYPTLK